MAGLSEAKSAILARMAEPDAARRMGDLIDELELLAPMDGVSEDGLLDIEGRFSEAISYINNDFCIPEYINAYLSSNVHELFNEKLYNQIIIFILFIISEDFITVENNNLTPDQLQVDIKGALETIFKSAALDADQQAQIVAMVATQIMQPSSAKPVVGVHTAALQSDVAAAADLPVTAPELWENRPKGEKSIAFLRRVYGEYLEAPDLRAHLRGIDRALYQTLAGWAQRNTIPDDLGTFFRDPRKENNTAMLEAHGVATPKDVLELDIPQEIKDRLYAAALRKKPSDRER